MHMYMLRFGDFHGSRCTGIVGLQAGNGIERLIIKGSLLQDSRLQTIGFRLLFDGYYGPGVRWTFCVKPGFTLELSPEQISPGCSGIK